MSIHMGIPRYDIYERPGDDDPLDECARGRVVLYSDHLADKQAALDAQQAAHAAEVERLNEQLEDGRKLAKESYAAAVQFKSERDAAVRERDVALEALEKLARLGNEPELGNSDGNRIAQSALAKIKGGRG